MGKILFCDDEKYRFDALVEFKILPKETRFENNIFTCFGLLAEPHNYEEIWLDYDFLNQTEFYGIPHYTGGDLAGELVKQNYRGLVRIHSMNEEGAGEIEEILNKGEVPCSRVDLLDLLGERLKWTT